MCPITRIKMHEPAIIVFPCDFFPLFIIEDADEREDNIQDVGCFSFDHSIHFSDFL